MKTYTAFFYTKADWAKTTIKAPNPELALQRAREIEETDFLDFHEYDSGAGVEHIEIRSSDGKVAEWRDPDLVLHLAAPGLLTALTDQTQAAQAVIDNWSEGDLAAAVRALDACIAPARAAIAKAT